MRHVHTAASFVIVQLVLITVPASSIPTHSDSSLSPDPAPAVVDSTTADSLDAMVAPILGTSGNLRALIGLPASLANSPAVEPFLSDRISVPGVHSLGLVAPDGDSLVAISMEAFPRKRSANFVGYRMGLWPTKGLAARDPR